MEKQRPKIGMGIYVVKEGKVLLMLRAGSHERDTWAPPGGHLEMGESFIDCAKRELWEETGLKLKDIELLPATNNIFSTSKHYVNLDVIAKGVTGEFQNKEPEKCKKLEWFDIDSFPVPLMLPVKNLFETYPEFKSKLKQTNSFI